MKILLLFIIVLHISFIAQAQVLINEVFASNASTTLDTKYYNYSGWVELFNQGLTDTELGNYYFSDDKNNKLKWKLEPGLIKSKQFAIFWFNEMNNGKYTSFKLDAKGSKLFLSKSDGSLVDSVTYPKQYTNISYTRFPDGNQTWKYNIVPTFKAANSSQAYTSFTSLPVFSQLGGLYTSTFFVSITTSNPLAEIRYTTNGSEPKQSSKLYSSAIPIKYTTIIRAKVYEPGLLPSEIVTQTYIFPDHDIQLPTYSISTDSINLWDNMLGIYADGTNGITEFCSSDPKNYNQDWERAVNIEYFDSLGNQKINQMAGIKIAGHCSRGFPQKSFNIIPRNLYGAGKLKYPFFRAKNTAEFDRLFLRNSGNDWGSAFLRDALFNTLVGGKMDIDYNAYQPSVVFLNGNYWGMLDTREKIDEHFIMSNYNLSENQFDMLENYGSVMMGTADNYNNFINFVSTNDLTNPTNYENVKSLMDVNEYINYMVTQIYIGNTDWPGNNIKYWRSKLGGGKWRWILTDLDFGFGVYDPNINHNTLQFALEPNGPAWPNPPWSTLLFRRLITNSDFQTEFVKRFANYLNTVFEPNTVINAIDSLQQNMSYEMYYHNQKWQGIWDWDGKVDFLRTFAKHRPGYVRQHLVNAFGIQGTYKLSISSNIPNAGFLYVDNMPVNGNQFNGTYFKNYSVNLKSAAKSGYKFQGWYKQIYETDSVVLINKADTWRYSDYGSIPASDWYSNNYNDNTWKSGNAQFGYGDNDEITIIDFGNDPNNKYITTYFRKIFNISDLATYGELKLNLLVDDGAVIYVNGKEVLRYRMAAGNVNYYTFANYGAGGTEETTFYEFDLPSGILQEGNNTIAVEVHQSSASSSDVSFDLQLKTERKENLKEEFMPGQYIDLISNQNTALLAKFKNLGNLPDIYINEFVADNQNGATDESGITTPWIELYNASPNTVDIAGLYISNSIENLTLWQIPQGDVIKTSIDPYGFLLLWADGQVGEGILHMPFELSKSGGKLFITSITGTDTTVVDSLTYLTQIENVAYGRYTDGIAGIYYLASPTPLSKNAAPNLLPKITSSPILTAHVQENYSYNITTSDFENDDLKIDYLNLPPWLNLSDNNNGTATLAGIPLAADKGDNQVVITVSDGKNILHTEQSFTIKVQGPLGFSNQEIEKWNIFPNPVRNFVNIVPSDKERKYQIRITNLYGKVVIEKNEMSGNYNLDLSALTNGVYFLVSRVNEDTFITKIIKSE